MSLAWTTIAVLILLFPGFLFFFGLYFHERATRETIQASVLSELALTVLVAFVVHTLAYVGSSTTCQALPIPCISLQHLFAVLQLEGAAQLGLGELGKVIDENIWWIFLYFALTGLGGFFAGLIASNSIVAGHLKGLSVHRWIYDLIPDDEHLVYAHVLTNLHHNGRIVVYRGFLHHFYFTKDGKVSYLVLSNCSRYYLLLNEQAIDTSPTAQWSRIGHTHGNLTADPESRLSTFMMIEGENIANVVFDRHRAAVLTRVSEEEVALAISEVKSEESDSLLSS